jgi:hypothetical protein
MLAFDALNTGDLRRNHSGLCNLRAATPNERENKAFSDARTRNKRFLVVPGQQKRESEWRCTAKAVVAVQ